MCHAVLIVAELRLVAVALLVAVLFVAVLVVAVYQKRGRGIFRRFFHCVPSSGPHAINRRICGADTLEGSSKLHTFVGVCVLCCLGCSCN